MGGGRPADCNRDLTSGRSAIHFLYWSPLCDAVIALFAVFEQAGLDRSRRCCASLNGLSQPNPNLIYVADRQECGLNLVKRTRVTVCIAHRPRGAAMTPPDKN
jgi:hypothetical protein